MSKTKLRAIELIYGSDLHATRFMLGLAELVWAIALIWPGDTFSRPTYSMMASIAPEECWAVVFGMSAYIQFCILFHGNYHSRLAVIFACFNSLFWIFTVISMYMSVYPPPGAISGELALAFGAAWVFIRSGVPCLTFDPTGHYNRKTDIGHA